MTHYYPFYFCYRHLVEERGLPEYPGLRCEKGHWWIIGENVEFYNDHDPIRHLWDFWESEDPGRLRELFSDIEALERYWKAYSVLPADPEEEDR